MARLWDRIEFSVLVAGIVIAGGLAGFVQLLEVARDSTPRGFDSAILLALREAGRPDDPIGPLWLEGAVRDITSLGSTIVLVLITAGVFAYMLILRNAADAIFLLVAVGGGQAISSALKFGIDRPRPDLVPHLVDVQTLSFPSGHAMLSAVTYLTLGSLLARIAPGRAARAYVLGVAVLITLIVGASRVYLGVHWPSDVLAGWCAGFVWATLCWVVARYAMRRGHTASGGG